MRASERAKFLLIALLFLLVGLPAAAQDAKTPSHMALEALLKKIDVADAGFTEEQYEEVVAQTLEHFSVMAAAEGKHKGIPLKFVGSRLALQVGNVLLHRHARMEDARLIARSAQSVYATGGTEQAALMEKALAGTRKGFTELAGEDQFDTTGDGPKEWGPFEHALLLIGGVFLLGGVIFLVRSKLEAPEGLSLVDADLQKNAQTSLNLGIRMLQQDKIEDALKYFQKVADLESGLQDNGQYFLALVNLQKGDTEKTRTLIEEIDFEKIEADEAYNLGDQLERRGQTLMAKRVFEKVYLGDVNFKDVKDRLEKLREETSTYSEEDVATVIAERVIEERFDDVQLVASGGMGFVFSVKDRQLEGKRLALKVLSPFYANDEDAYTRFIHEARGLASLEHPNIIKIHDVFETNLPYYTMDFHDSPDLKGLLAAEGSLPLERARAIGLQLCTALHAAHQVGVVHRDVKPANALVGDGDHVTLLDFGIARFGEGAGLTLTGQVLGSPRYMAPEQHTGEDVDQRCDIYSAAVIVYQMLVGELPPAGPGGFFVGEYPELPKDCGASPELREVLGNCLSPKVQFRPESMQALIDVLGPAASG